jgi:hypothetical protein
MSSTYSQESAASPSDLNELECVPSPSARSIHIAEMSSPSTGLASPSLKTLPTSEVPTLEQLTLFAAASRARTSVSPAKARGSAAREAAYGQSTPELLARFDPVSSSWRTSQFSLEGGLTEFLETWPRSGLMRSGIAYQLPPLAPRISETGSGLWPTPVVPNGGRSVAHVNDWRGRTAYHNGKKVQVDLAQAVKRWPTPTAVDGRRGNKPPRPWDTGVPLAQAVAMFPTPTARDFRSPGRSRLERTGSKAGECLPQAIGGQLNPTWVEWLMGFPAEWTALSSSEIRSSRKSRKSSGEQS